MRLFGVGADPSPVDALGKARAKHARLQEQALAADDELVELKVQAQHAAEGFGTGLDDLSHEIAAAEAKVGALASAMNMGAGPSLAPTWRCARLRSRHLFQQRGVVVDLRSGPSRMVRRNGSRRSRFV